MSSKMIAFRFWLEILSSSQIARLFDCNMFRTNRWVILTFDMWMVEEMKKPRLLGYSHL